MGVLIVFTDQLFSLLTWGFNPVAGPPRYYYALSLLTDTFYTVLGAYCCAALARDAARAATLGLMIGGELIGISAVIALWHTTPRWFALALLLVYPPAVRAGSRARTRGEPSQAA